MTSISGSPILRPIRRFVAYKVLSGFVTACLFAWRPTSLLPSSVKATTDGVVRAPSAFSITLAARPSMIATQEFVVPRSMPTTSPCSVASVLRAVWRACCVKRCVARRRSMVVYVECY